MFHERTAWRLIHAGDRIQEIHDLSMNECYEHPSLARVQGDRRLLTQRSDCTVVALPHPRNRQDALTLRILIQWDP